jgi:DNA-binding transcriptional ArsR family regulator
MGSTARVYGPSLDRERTGNLVRSGKMDGSPLPDYELEDTLVVTGAAQLRALGDEVRGRIVALLGERTASVSELAAELEMPKGTVGHHVKVLEEAGLVRVVHTRRVRALTEKFYGRVARLFVYQSGDDADAKLVRTVAAMSLRTAAVELETSSQIETNGLVRARLSAADARRFGRRLDKLIDDFRKADTPDGNVFRLVGALYRRDPRDA